MNKYIKLIGIICLICILSFLLCVLLLPPPNNITTARIDYLKFDKAVDLFLKDKDYFLPNDKEVTENNHAYYSYIYKPEGWSFNEFCIHLSMDHIDAEKTNEYLSQIQAYTTCIHLDNGEDIWLSKETAESIEEKLNTDAHDGMILFFYIFKVSEPTGSVDFWVCELEDTGSTISPEFIMMIEKIYRSNHSL